MNEKEWISVPALFAVSLDETISFWESLGYKRTYYQKAPYPYAVISRNGYDMHFSQQKWLKAEENPYGCLVMVTDVEAVHQEFSRLMKESMGKVPNKGLPRITRMRPGQTRFTVTDPSGNWVIFIKFGDEDEEVALKSEQRGEQTPLELAISRAIRFREFKNEPEDAAKILDVALERHSDEAKILIARALLLRADIAIDLEDTASAKASMEKLYKLNLSTEEHVSIASEIERISALLV